MISWLWNGLRQRGFSTIVTDSKAGLFILEMGFRILYGNKPRKIYSALGYSIVVDPKDSGIARRYLLEGEHEGFGKSFILENIFQWEVFIDVGSNIGDWTIFFAANNKNASVYSFEPHPELFGALKKNVEINNIKNITLYNFALGSEESESYLNCDAENFGNNTLLESVDVGLMSKKVKILVKRLDDLINFDGLATLLKIDVQGFEAEVLAGAQNFLKKSQASIILEIDEYTNDNIFLFLKKSLLNRSLCIIDNNKKELLMVSSLEEIINEIPKRKYFDIFIK